MSNVPIHHYTPKEEKNTGIFIVILFSIPLAVCVVLTVYAIIRAQFGLGVCLLLFGIIPLSFAVNAGRDSIKQGKKREYQEHQRQRAYNSIGCFGMPYVGTKSYIPNGKENEYTRIVENAIDELLEKDPSGFTKEQIHEVTGLPLIDIFRYLHYRENLYSEDDNHVWTKK